MKKIISAVTAFALTAGMMAGITVVNAEGPITTEAELKAAFLTGGTYELGNDIAVTEELTPANDLTLNLNGKTINLGNASIALSKAGTYKFENGTISSGITGKTAGTISIINTTTDAKPNLELSGVTVSAGDVALYMVTPGSVSIKDNSQLKNTQGTDAYGVVLANNGTVDMTDSTITYTAAKNKAFSAIRSEANYPVFNLTNVTINRTTGNTTGRFITVLAASSAKMTINGGTYTGNNECIYWIGKNTLNISGGTFKAAVSGGVVFNASSKNIIITGGTFGDDPSDYVDLENYTVTANSDSTYTVAAKPAPTPFAGDVTEVENGGTTDGDITTKVFSFEANANGGSFNTVTVNVEGKEPQSKTVTTITDEGSAVFAIVFVGNAGTEFPTKDQISVTVE